MFKSRQQRFELSDILFVLLVAYCLKSAVGVNISDKYHLTDVVNPVVVLDSLGLW